MHKRNGRHSRNEPEAKEEHTVDRVAWILNLREPFGAALGRELVSRGWSVIGGDPGAPERVTSDRTDRRIEGSEHDQVGGSGKRSLSDWLREEQAAEDIGRDWDNRPVAYGESEASGGETHGPKIGENAEVPTGTGTSGLNDFEGSVGFGPETNDRRTAEDSVAADMRAGEAAGEQGGQGVAEEAAAAGHRGGEAGADLGAGSAAAAERRSGEVGVDLGAGESAEEVRGRSSEGPPSDNESGGPSQAAANSAAPLPGHGRLRAVPLDASRPGALEQAARLTAELAGRIDLLVLNAADSAPHDPAPGRLGETKSAALESASAGNAADAKPAEPGSSPIEGADTTEGRLRDYAAYALTPLQAAEYLLPLMEAAGGLKRICFVSSHEGSVSAGDVSAPIGRAMARAALHMQAKLLFNDLRREGYTFRLYDPGLSPLRSAAPIGREAGGSAAAAGEAMASLPSLTAESARFAAGFFANPHADEGRLVLTGSRGEEWPF